MFFIICHGDTSYMVSGHFEVGNLFRDYICYVSIAWMADYEFQKSVNI